MRQTTTNSATAPAARPHASLSPMELAGAWLTGAVAAAALWLWVTAQLAALFVSGDWVSFPASQMGRIAFEVMQRPGDPRAAFPADVTTQLPGALGFWTAAAFVALVLLVPAAWLVVRRAKRPSQTVEGARWADAKDAKPLAVRSPVPGRLTLGYGPGGGLLAAEPGHSLLVLGPTQSGKTSGLAIPAILEWPGPVVATSVKADLLQDTAHVRRRHGEVWVYDPSGSVPGFDQASWTPLAACDTWRGALRTAGWMSQAARDRQLGENDFWYSNAAKLLAPLLFAARTADLTMRDVVRWVDLQEREEIEWLLKLTGVPEALTAAKATWGREERTRSSVYTTAETVLAAYADPRVAASAHRSDIDPATLLDGGAHTIYISAPLHEQARLRPLFTALVETVLAAAYEHVAEKGRLDPGLLLVLDEAANIAPLRDLAQIASTAAGLGIQLVTIWQDRAQIVHRYGNAASTVVNNHRAKLLLSGISDAETTAELSQIIGEAEVARHSTTVDADGRTSATRATHTQPLASAALRQLRPFEGVLVYGHLPPARMRLRPWFKNPAWSKKRR